jgi:hypothetical protein
LRQIDTSVTIRTAALTPLSLNRMAAQITNGSGRYSKVHANPPGTPHEPAPKAIVHTTTKPTSSNNASALRLVVCCGVVACANHVRRNGPNVAAPSAFAPYQSAQDIQ